MLWPRQRYFRDNPGMNTASRWFLRPRFSPVRISVLTQLFVRALISVLVPVLVPVLVLLLIPLTTLPTVCHADPGSLLGAISRGYRNPQASAEVAERLPPQQIAARRQPDQFKLVRAWRAAGIARPGNVVCFDTPAGSRIVALDGWRTVVVLDHNGREMARHEIDLPPDAAIGFLRTAVDASGRRWWLGGHRGNRQVFVCDAAWRLHAAYPNSESPRHEGIRTVFLDDLNDDGEPEITVVSSGSVGMDVASLDGRRVWQEQSVGTVLDAVPGMPDEGRARGGVCVDGPGRLAPVTMIRGGTNTPRANEPTLGQLQQRWNASPPVHSLFGGPVAPNGGSSVDASVRITLLDRDVPSYFQVLEHLLRYCARPPVALERLSVIRDADGRITKVRSVLPRHKAANWVGPGRGRKSTRPGTSGVVELSPFEFLVCGLAALLPPRRYEVDGLSMAPGLLPGDVVGTAWCPLLDRLRRPQRHERWILTSPDGTPAIKRVVGLPGETVSIRDSDLAIGGWTVLTPPHVLAQVASSVAEASIASAADATTSDGWQRTVSMPSVLDDAACAPAERRMLLPVRDVGLAAVIRIRESSASSVSATTSVSDSVGVRVRVGGFVIPWQIKAAGRYGLVAGRLDGHLVGAVWPLEAGDGRPEHTNSCLLPLPPTTWDVAQPWPEGISPEAEADAAVTRAQTY